MGQRRIPADYEILQIWPVAEPADVGFLDQHEGAQAVFLAYFDDSSEGGIILLSCVLVHDSGWSTLHDAWLDYRRWLRDNFGVPIQRAHGRRRPHVELKGSDFANGSGPWLKLPVGRRGRLDAMRVGLRLIGRHSHVFAVAWDPARPMTGLWPARHESPIIDVWTTCLERLVTYSKKHGDHKDDFVLAITDSGYIPQFRRVYRRMRRFHYVGSQLSGSLAANAPMFIDDPSERDSKDSTFVQMADLTAYAALRELRPRPDVHTLWASVDDGMGTSTTGILRDVNKFTKGQTPGIKMIPE